jgi:hypothetical protein
MDDDEGVDVIRQAERIVWAAGWHLQEQAVLKRLAGTQGLARARPGLRQDDQEHPLMRPAWRPRATRPDRADCLHTVELDLVSPASVRSRGTTELARDNSKDIKACRGTR